MSNLTPGTYLGRLTDSALGAVGKNDTPAMILTFELVYVAADGAWVPMAPISREVQFYITDKSRDYAFRDLGRLGFNGNFDAPAFSAIPTDGVELDLINETYDGKTNDKVSIAMLKGAREKKPVNADAKRQIAALWKTAATSTAKPSAPPPPRAAAPAAAAQPATRAPGTPGSAGDPNEPPF